MRKVDKNDFKLSRVGLLKYHRACVPYALTVTRLSSYSLWQFHSSSTTALLCTKLNPTYKVTKTPLNKVNITVFFFFFDSGWDYAITCEFLRDRLYGVITLRSLIFSFSQTMAYLVDLCQEGPQLSYEMTKIPLNVNFIHTVQFQFGR